MNYRTMTLGQVAPATTAEADLLDDDDQVWLLNLDQVEPHTGRLLSKQTVDFDQVGSSTNWFDESNVLYSKLRPYLNKVYLPDGKGLCTTELVPLKPNPDLITREYLAHYLRSEKFLRWVNEQIDGAKMPRVSMKIFWNHEIDLPPLEEQKRIAAILDKADSLRRKRAQAIALADDFLRATFLDMFGDPVTNPKGWPVKQLQELCDVATGATPSREVAAYYGGSIPWVKTGEVDSDWITTSEEFITEAALNKTNCKLFPPRTILMAMYGQGKTRGKTGMLGLSAATNQACAAILPSGEIQPDFLLCLLKLSYESIRALGRGGNQENLNLSIVKSLGIIVPDPIVVYEFLRVRERVLALVKIQITAAGDGALLNRVLQGDKLS